MYRLAHISDIHLGPLPAIRRRQLFSKRITGYVNWRRTRMRPDQPVITAELVAHLHKLAPDHVAITGDLINLGLEGEITNAAAWLASLGDPADHTVVLGNHDAYVRGARRKALEAWQDWVCGDGGGRVGDAGDYPVLRRRGNISIIALNSARASAPFLATGYFKQPQGERLRAMLASEREAGRFRVLLIHHAPFPGATARHKRLLGMRYFLDAVAAEGAELVLHGHTHLDTLTWINGRQTRVPVVCVPAAYQWPGHRKPPAAINLLTIGGKPENWSLTLERHALALAPQAPGHTAPAYRFVAGEAQTLI